ncbi:MAG TPA: hypothetical protein ENH29_07315 [Bacteroidetes bacterium]|nr:hypothetical protein [Bacteroidota bacterium]
MEPFSVEMTDTTQQNRAIKPNFEAELINRFFDPKSYYLRGFMSFLKSDNVLLQDPLETVTVGLLVDEIINANNKIEKLDQLTRFNRFHFYHQQLHEGIKYLQDSQLSTQQMMDIVGNLGRSLAETLIELVAQPEAKTELLKIVGLSETSEIENDPEKLPEEIKEKTTLLSDIENNEPDSENEPWSFFQTDVAQKLSKIEEKLTKLTEDKNNWQLFKSIKNDIRDLRDWSMIQGDQGIEAISHKILLLFETVYTRGPEKRVQIFPVLQDSIETIRAVSRSGRGNEHLDIVRVMVNQIDQKRGSYPEEDNSEKTKIKTGPTMPEISADSQTEIATSLVTPEPGPGEESSVSPAPADEVTSTTPEENPPPKTETSFPENILDLSEETMDEMDPEPENDVAEPTEFAGLTTEYDLEIEQAISENSDESHSPVSEPIQQEPAREPENIDENDAPELFDSIRESEILSEMVNDHKEEIDDLTLPDFPDTKSDFSEINFPDDLSLPGEDDEELLEIISDLQAEQGVYEPPPETEESTKEEKSGDYRALSYNPGYEETEKSSSSQTGIDKPGSGFDFVSEADMYFSFAKKALQQLMKNSTDKQALEDMELACYSLKVIGNKLGYAQIGRIMTDSEKLIQKGISEGYKLPANQINGLFTLFNQLEQAGREKTLQEPDRQKWLGEQASLMKKWTDFPTAEAEAKNENKEPAAGTSSDDKDSKNPLDFLLFDDSSKFFKQMLNE